MSELLTVDWNKILSYNAPITAVITSRGFGKTFGLRLQFIRDYLHHGYTFVEIVRHKNELQAVQSNYFDKIGEFFPDFMFKTQSNVGYIARKPQDKKNKPVWHVIGYFVAMSQYQLVKKQSGGSFKNVHRMVLDEFTIELDDVFHRYNPNEWDVMTSIIDSCTREIYGVSVPPKLYLLGNATDIRNPYFEKAGITGNPHVGFSWHMCKNFLLYYDINLEYQRNKSNTLAGKMGEYGNNNTMLENKFSNANDEWIKSKSAQAVFIYGIMYKKHAIGVWADSHTGLYYLTAKIPKNDNRVYALTVNDKPNYLLLKRNNQITLTLYQAYRYRMVYFSSSAVYGRFLDMVKFLGYR